MGFFLREFHHTILKTNSKTLSCELEYFRVFLFVPRAGLEPAQPSLAKGF